MASQGFAEFTSGGPADVPSTREGFVGIQHVRYCSSRKILVQQGRIVLGCWRKAAIKADAVHLHPNRGLHLQQQMMILPCDPSHTGERQDTTTHHVMFLAMVLPKLSGNPGRENSLVWEQNKGRFCFSLSLAGRSFQVHPKSPQWGWFSVLEAPTSGNLQAILADNTRGHKDKGKKPDRGL